MRDGRPPLAPRVVRLLDFEAGDPGAVPASKVGGAPWWPAGRSRPLCGRGHGLTFVAQVRLADVPGFADDPDRLLSFHYCEACAADGEASYGWEPGPAEEVGRYAVTPLALGPSTAVDGLGAIAPLADRPLAADATYPPATLRFFDTEEWPVPMEDEDTWEALDEEIWEANIVQPYGELTLAYPDRPVHFERSKLGGWPSWVGEPAWPSCAHGRRMPFVGQLGYWDFPLAFWASGGFAYLFVCPRACTQPHGELVIQTT